MNVIFHAPSRARCRSAHLQPTSPAVYLHPDESSSPIVGSAVRREEQTVILSYYLTASHVEHEHVAKDSWLVDKVLGFYSNRRLAVIIEVFEYNNTQLLT